MHILKLKWELRALISFGFVTWQIHVLLNTQSNLNEWKKLIGSND